MTFDEAAIERLRADYPECFACGRDNPIGLGIDGFTLDEGVVTAKFSPRPAFAGFANTLHGGIVATALDEASAWAATLNHGMLVFTARLEIRFRAPAIADHPFLLESQVQDRRGRRFTISAAMKDDSRVVAESTGIFVTAHDLRDVFPTRGVASGEGDDDQESDDDV